MEKQGAGPKGAEAPLLFVTGTDTGVGKTTIVCLLAAALRRCGARVGVIKPVETGCARAADGECDAADAKLICSAAGGLQDARDAAPYRFLSPVAPAVAARAEGREISIPYILERIEALRLGGWDIVLMEGAGGLMVPLQDDYTYADLAADSRAAALLVIGSRLGAINHALLTLEVMRGRNIPVCGYVLNELFGPQAEEKSRTDALLQAADAISTNRDALRRSAAKFAAPELCCIGKLSEEQKRALPEGGACAEADKLAGAVLEYLHQKS